MAPSSKPPLYLRWWGLLWGIVTFFWLPVEDVRIIYITVISVVWCFWLGFYAAWRGLLGKWRLRLFWLGIFSGLLFLPVSFMLILFKAGLHGHGFLDFSFYQIGRLALLTPVWAALGGVVGKILSLFK